MKVIRQLFFALPVILGMFLLTTTATSASEGEFVLRNRVGETARCEGGSVLMQDRNYNIYISCREISYPGGTEVFDYVVWGVPTSGGNHFRLGTLGLGKVSFKTRTAFSSLYVTKEETSNPRTPSGALIMQGNVTPFETLDGPAPTPSGDELGTPSPTPVATSAPRNIGRILAAGGVLAFITLFGVILVIFVITRK